VDYARVMRLAKIVVDTRNATAAHRESKPGTAPVTTDLAHQRA
jgi:hypothetical protein